MCFPDLCRYSGVDWANVGSQGATVALSATTVATITTYTGNTLQTGDSFARLGAPAGASVSADLVALQADADNIQTRIPAALASGRMTSDMTALDGSATAASNLNKSALTIVTGAAVAGTLSTTQMTTDLSEATDDHYNGRVIIWTSGVLTGQAATITDYTGATKKLTFAAITEAPSVGDMFNII